MATARMYGRLWSACSLVSYAGRLVTLVSPTYDVIGDIEDLEIDLFDSRLP